MAPDARTGKCAAGSFRLGLAVLAGLCLAFVAHTGAHAGRLAFVWPAAHAAAQDAPRQQTADDDAEERLHQLIAQAEALAGAEALARAKAMAAVAEQLEALEAALTLKAALLDEGEDTSEIDREIATLADRLQESLDAAIDAATVETAVGEDVELEPGLEDDSDMDETGEDAPDAGSGVLTYAAEALTLLERIQALQGARRDAHDALDPDQAGDAILDDPALEPAAIDDEFPEDPVEDEPAGGGGVKEETLQDLTGVVTLAGEPVEGVTVTDPDSGATAVTDEDGQYMLEGLPAGRWANIVLSKRGKRLGEGQLDLPPGRDGIADFELSPETGGAATTRRVLPATAVVAKGAAAKAGTGSVKGTLRDADGRPVVRALVTLGTIARARTDSSGRYTFLNVPAGSYELKARKPGVPTRTSRVQVTARRSTEASLALPRPSATRTAPTKALTRAGSSTIVRGRVVAAGGAALPDAKVTLMRGRKAVSRQSGPRGEFRFTDLEAGRYRVVVSKGGYQTLGEDLSLAPGGSQVRTYRLKRTAPAARTAPAPAPARAAPKPTPAPARVSPTPAAPASSAVGRVAGRVLDASTRRPIAGALVTLQGHDPVRTSATGAYTIVRVKPAAHRLVVRIDGYAPVERRIQVTAGQVTRLDVSLQPRAAAATRVAPPAPAPGPAEKGKKTTTAVVLTGRVVDAGTRRPIVGAVVSIGGTSARTDVRGAFRLANLRQGRHQVAIRADGYAQATEVVTLGPKEQATATFALKRASAPVRR